MEILSANTRFSQIKVAHNTFLNSKSVLFVQHLIIEKKQRNMIMQFDISDRDRRIILSDCLYIRNNSVNQNFVQPIRKERRCFRSTNSGSSVSNKEELGTRHFSQSWSVVRGETPVRSSVVVTRRAHRAIYIYAHTHY